MDGFVYSFNDASLLMLAFFYFSCILHLQIIYDHLILSFLSYCEEWKMRGLKIQDLNACFALRNLGLLSRNKISALI